jgi:hypothetical protein
MDQEELFAERDRLEALANEIETIQDFIRFVDQLEDAYDKGALIESEAEGQRGFSRYLETIATICFNEMNRADGDIEPSWDGFGLLLLQGFYKY